MLSKFVVDYIDFRESFRTKEVEVNIPEGADEEAIKAELTAMIRPAPRQIRKYHLVGPGVRAKA